MLLAVIRLKKAKKANNFIINSFKII